MSPEDAMERLNGILAHAWMVRTFLKHADEIQEDEGMLDVPRTLYDSIRAVEPAYQRKDTAEYLRRLKGKLSKFRKAAEYYNAHFREFSPHTNFEMAGLSLTMIVKQLEEVFERIQASGGRESPVSVAESEIDDSRPPLA